VTYKFERKNKNVAIYKVLSCGMNLYTPATQCMAVLKSVAWHECIIVERKYTNQYTKEPLEFIKVHVHKMLSWTFTLC